MYGNSNIFTWQYPNQDIPHHYLQVQLFGEHPGAVREWVLGLVTFPAVSLVPICNRFLDMCAVSVVGCWGMGGVI